MMSEVNQQFIGTGNVITVQVTAVCRLQMVKRADDRVRWSE